LHAPGTNRLVETASPYLLQHAHNPVDWYPWGPEALDRARTDGRPILLSIGYSSCHWCHVMAHESFEDDAIASFMNEKFVCIKVDREERPDIDEIYMAATLALNHGQGGWPMTVFLTPDQEPFFAGTYFPPEDRWGRPGFRTVLERVAQLWDEDRDALVDQGRRVAEHLRASAVALPGGRLDAAVLDRVVTDLSSRFDARHGGFGGAPKFPPATVIRLLLRIGRRSGSARAIDMAAQTLEAMAQGGIRDHVGGGFHRYSTDERWLVPHFEKMLYDNALLTRAYLEGFQVTGSASFSTVARETLDYVLREMTSPEGGFFAASDADSEGAEGRYFTWNPAEVRAAVGDEEQAHLFCAWYDVTESGNWEGRSIPNRLDPPKAVAWRAGCDAEVVEGAAVRARPLVLAARQKRVAPGLDDKILAGWNGMMIASLAEAGLVLGETRYTEAAVRAADVIVGNLVPEGGAPLRCLRAGRARHDATLEDVAYLAEGLLTLFEAGGGPRFLETAERLVDHALRAFAAAEGGFFSTASDGEALLVRFREGHDAATPAANAVLAEALIRLARHTDRADLDDSARRALEAYSRAIADQPSAFAHSLIALDLMLHGPTEVVLVGNDSTPGFSTLRAVVGAAFVPGRVLVHHDPTQGHPGASALTRTRSLVDDRATAYVCQGATCLLPITDPRALTEALGGRDRPVSEERGR